MMPAIPMSPPPSPTPNPAGPESSTAAQTASIDKAGSVPGIEFGQKMNVDAASKVADLRAQTVQPLEFKDGMNPLDQLRSIRDEISSIRVNVEKQVTDGTVSQPDGRVNLWRMLDLQTRAQDVHFRVELLTKLIDHGSSGIKQLSQTQA